MLWRMMVVLVLPFVAVGCATTAPSRPLAVPPQAVPALDGSYHRVVKGDTLWRIARSFGVGVDTLATVNRLPNASHPFGAP